MLLLQPFIRVYAADETVAAVGSPTEVINVSPQTQVQVLAPDGEQTQSGAPSGSDIPTIEREGEVEAQSADLASSSTEASLDVALSENMDLVLEPTVVATSTETSTSTENASSTDTLLDIESGTSTHGTDQSTTTIKDENASSTQVVDEMSSTTDAETTIDEEVVEDSVPSINVDQLLQEREDQLRESLRKQVEAEYANGCVSLDNVGYYCLKSDAPKFQGDLIPSDTISDVTAEIEPGGSDKEIFATKKGERIQLTSNEWEDSFPARDLSGKSVVWQGQKEGRWQIFYASFASATPKIIQLTQGSESNFNPKVEGDTIVWQSWIDNNWEIYLARPFAGVRDTEKSLPEDNLRVGVDGAWEVKRITTALAHDMFPSISNDVVTWQRAENNGWSIYAYSVNSGITTRITDDGSHAEHPRFTLVWDEGGEDGTRRLMSYDLASGERQDLTQQAQQAPYQRPYTPTAPVEAPDQAALPATAGASTAKIENGNGDGDGAGAGGNGNDNDDPGTLDLSNSSSSAPVVTDMPTVLPQVGTSTDIFSGGDGNSGTTSSTPTILP
jgi:beta propeller repeat protein